jgi:hypothetical protein
LPDEQAQLRREETCPSAETAPTAAISGGFAEISGIAGISHYGWWWTQRRERRVSANNREKYRENSIFCRKIAAGLE